MYKKISLRVLLDRIHSGQFGNIFIQAKEDKSLTRADMWEWKFSELHMHDFYEYQETSGDVLQVGGIKYQVNTQESLEELLEALEEASKGGWI